MNKHAYLIMAHNNFSILSVLLECLDYPANDIYIHIDKKSSDFDATFIPRLKYSELYFVKRMNVSWGGYSQIKCEIRLLEEAYKRKYSYYHFISGVDMPLKRQKEIHTYFDKSGKDHLYINNKQSINKSYIDKIKYYHWFQDKLGKHGKGMLYSIIDYLESRSIQIQKRINIDRTRKSNITYYKGGNWFDITNNMVEWVLCHKAFIKKYFRCTSCGDEIFLPTLAMMSPYRDNIYTVDFRTVDWTRGTPYIWGDEDYELLCSSDGFFARKFDEKKSMDIVHRLARRLNN